MVRYSVILLGAFIGCSGAMEEAVTYTVSDSAGVEVIHSTRPAWRDEEAWSVDPDANLDLSGADDEDLYNLRSPRLLDDGRLVLYNAGTCEIRVYDEMVRIVLAWGGCGEGPREFEEVLGIWSWQADSFVVLDQIPQRWSVFDPDGELVRTGLVQGSADMPLPLVREVLPNGTIVVTGSRNPGGRETPGIEVSQVSLGLIDDLESAPRIIGTFPGRVLEYDVWNGLPSRNVLPFSGSTAFATGDDRLFIGFSDIFAIHDLDLEGRLHRIIRRSFTPVPVTGDDIEWLLQRRLGEVESAENQRAVRAAFRELQHADVMPAFGVPAWPGGAAGGPAMLVDDLGNLWVFEHYRPGEYANNWSVFSQRGVWLGTVTLPDQLVPAQIGRDFVLGRWSDEDGFVHVRRHRIQKPEA